MAKDPFRDAECWTDCPGCGNSFGWNPEDRLTGQACGCGYVFTGHERRSPDSLRFYRGCTIERNDHNGMWRTNSTPLPLAADTLAGLKSLIREALSHAQ